MKRLTLVLVVALSVAGCDIFDDDDPAPNQSPVANAGAAQTVDENTIVTLNGSGSSDADGSIATFAWTQTAGPAATLSGANQAMPTFTAPAVNGSTTLTFQLIVTDNTGATNSATVNVNVNDVTNQAPAANAGADQSVMEGALVTLNASASSDADGTITAYAWTQTAGTAALLSNANQAMATFTAPAVTANTTLTFQVVVTDNNGATSMDTVNVAVTDVPNQAPSANAGADQSVVEGTMVTLNGSASSDTDGSIAAYAWTQTTGAMVTITNADQAMASFTAPAVTASTALTFQLLVTDDMGAAAMDTVEITVTDTPSDVTISGKVTYDHVKHNPTTNGLDFSAATQDPVRGATVQALDTGNMVLTSTRTDDNGDYSLTVARNTEVKIRVRAEVIQVGPPSWDVRVVDNTNAGAPYVLDGSSSSSGTANSTRNLNAPSGWDNGTMSYSSARAAAPFAILESILEALQKTAAVDATVAFPALLTNWSPNNVPSTCPGGNADGCITTSNYDTTAIYILGAANNDTDEFDGHIIVHEWGHYFEDKLSRSDSTGGSHSGGDVLDIRIAFGEGFGNALSGIITADPSYRDSSGANQGGGFEINVETNNTEGWFSETTVQSLLYDLFDNTADGATDTTALGWGPLYNVFVSDAYKNNDARTSIAAYLARLKADNAASAAGITALATASNVNGTDAFGAGEAFIPPGTTNAGDITPIYTDIAPNGTAVQVCSINEFGTFNKLSNRRFMKLNIATAATYRIQAAAVAGGDVDMQLFQGRSSVASFGAIGNEDAMQALNPGIHVIEVFDYCNVSPGDGGCPAAGNARSCFNVTVTQM